MTDEELLARIAKRDQEAKQEAKAAFEELVRRYRGQFFGIASAKGLSPADAEEAASDGLMQVWRCAEQALGSAMSAKYWLRGVMVRMSINKFRKIKTRVMVEKSSTRFDDAGEFESDASEANEHDERDPWVDLSQPEVTRLQREHQRCVDNCLPKLSGVQREILVMLTYAGQTLSEVAQTTGESLGTIKSRQHYALEKMKQCIDRLLQGKSGGSK